MQFSFNVKKVSDVFSTIFAHEEKHQRDGQRGNASSELVLITNNLSILIYLFFISINMSTDLSLTKWSSHKFVESASCGKCIGDPNEAVGQSFTV